jgi:hypothetical protein
VISIAAVNLSEQIKANTLTVEELEAVVALLDQFELERSPIVRAAMAKLRWHIAASRNEVEHDPSAAQV